jgi:hypothetical protein
MIPRALIVCILAVLGWHFAYPRMPGFYAVPGQQRANYLHAQQFVHEAPADAKVICGSSMSDRLDGSKLGADHVKLTFPGGGPLTGLELIHGTGRTPPLVWVETNVILRATEEGLLDDALSPWRRKLREKSPIFKEEGRPSEFGVGFLKAVASKASKALETPKAAAALDKDTFADVMKANREHLDRKPDPKDLATKIARLGTLIDTLQSKGSKVILFEIPFDRNLTELAEPTAVRKALHERFPTDRYRWLDLKQTESWQTTDGIHLPPAEADKVVARMLEFEEEFR